MTKTSEPYARSGLIADRYIEVVENRELIIADRLRVLEHEFKELNLVPLAEAARRAGISYNGMKKRVSEGREMSIDIGAQTFVSPV